MKGCRTAARVKFCEGARTCVRTRWHYSKMHLEDCLYTRRMNAVCPPVFRTQHPDLRRRRIDFCCHSSYARMLPEISAKNSPRNSWWAYLHSDDKKGFQLQCRHCSYRTWKALYTLDLLYNHPMLKNVLKTWTWGLRGF